jgi:hypothetical protein
MKFRQQRAGASSNVKPRADDVDDARDVDVDDGAPLGHGPYHDPSVHAERETFTVTTQRCRGEYP